MGFRVNPKMPKRRGAAGGRRRQKAPPKSAAERGSLSPGGEEVADVVFSPLATPNRRRVVKSQAAFLAKIVCPRRALGPNRRCSFSKGQ